MRETTAAPGSALAAATELVLFSLDDDELHLATASRRGLARLGDCCAGNNNSLQR